MLLAVLAKNLTGHAVTHDDEEKYNCPLQVRQLLDN